MMNTYSVLAANHPINTVPISCRTHQQKGAPVCCGKQAPEIYGQRLPPEVMQSAAGYDVGTWAQEGFTNRRESLEYYWHKEYANQALAG